MYLRLCGYFYGQISGGVLKSVWMCVQQKEMGGGGGYKANKWRIFMLLFLSAGWCKYKTCVWAHG